MAGPEPVAAALLEEPILGPDWIIDRPWDFHYQELRAALRARGRVFPNESREGGCVPANRCIRSLIATARHRGLVCRRIGRARWRRPGEVHHLIHESVQLGLGDEEAKPADFVGGLLPNLDVLATPPEPFQLLQARVRIGQRPDIEASSSIPSALRRLRGSRRSSWKRIRRQSAELGEILRDENLNRGAVSRFHSPMIYGSEHDRTAD